MVTSVACAQDIKDRSKGRGQFKSCDSRADTMMTQLRTLASWSSWKQGQEGGARKSYEEKGKEKKDNNPITALLGNESKSTHAQTDVEAKEEKTPSRDGSRVLFPAFPPRS